MYWSIPYAQQCGQLSLSSLIVGCTVTTDMTHSHPATPHSSRSLKVNKEAKMHCDQVCKEVKISKVNCDPMDDARSIMPIMSRRD